MRVFRGCCKRGGGEGLGLIAVRRRRVLVCARVNVAFCTPADRRPNATLLRTELLHNVDNYKNKVRSSQSLMLFGWGDGGGGPDRDQLERLGRLSDVQVCRFQGWWGAMRCHAMPCDAVCYSVAS